MTLEAGNPQASGELLREKKRQIAKALIEAMRNHPPSIEDMDLVLNKIKEAFPELEALKGPMARLPEEISKHWFMMLPFYDIFSTVERKLKKVKKKRLPERAKDAFAHLLWLATNLLFMDDLLISAEKQEVIEKGEWTARELRAEQIQISIRVTNTLFQRITGSKDVLIFREDVPDFFTRLPTPCRGLDDFLGKIQSLATIFEVNLKPLRALVPGADPSWGSIKLVERWLQDKKASNYSEIINVWKNIIQLRKIPPTHAPMGEEIIDAIEFLGGKFPVAFSQLWNSVLDRFLESLVKFQEILTSLRNL